jgi:hypothetical protein
MSRWMAGRRGASRISSLYRAFCAPPASVKLCWHSDLAVTFHRCKSWLCQEASGCSVASRDVGGDGLSPHIADTKGAADKETSFSIEAIPRQLSWPTQSLRAGMPETPIHPTGLSRRELRSSTIKTHLSS